MKRLFLLVLTALFVLVSSAAAEDFDLSGMSYDQLVALREQLNLAIWNSQEWQEVTVPAGTWIIGEDIPAGHWSIRLDVKKTFSGVYYFDKLDAQGLDIDFSGYSYDSYLASDKYKNEEGFPLSIDIDMQEGYYFKCYCPVIFTPYAGKPDLGFK